MYQMDKSQKQFMKEKSQAQKSNHYIITFTWLLEHVKLVCGRKNENMDYLWDWIGKGDEKILDKMVVFF